MNSPSPKRPPGRDKFLAQKFSAFIRAEATQRGINPNQHRRQRIMRLFLVTVFSHNPDGWVLKGGTGMMIRLAEARHSKDVDLATAMPLEDALASLREALDASRSPLRWEITSKKQMTKNEGLQLTVSAFIGTIKLDTFNIDLSSTSRYTGAVDHIEIDAPGGDVFGELTAVIALASIPAQIADKICAIHEPHGENNTGTSMRPRDLVDLLLIQHDDLVELDLRPSAEKVAVEARRRGLALPAVFASIDDGGGVPVEQWRRKWSSLAKDSPLRADLADIDTAVAVAARCWHAILAAHTDPDGAAELRWSTERQEWTEL
ncbi:nucleotidyl transferase AbiEii/AbiGii toxin family protein [Tsukamurella ocularis]|uniref:nucleotidyl transferase AbiEii/AbiGii toxin family protein n=1 Tax=Tsukamurella ocularis TaxID=1970234 RepID=UPI002167AEAC|nr:nucleotidyl transferase AbiEii/AbiGii toxin family protein [Tsukamurella ocularis]MCS3853349.1 hypothetical protein [Tsukamurella ocularis]